MNSDGSEMISRVKRIYLRENKKENLFEFRLFQRRPSDGINATKECVKKLLSAYVINMKKITCCLCYHWKNDIDLVSTKKYGITGKILLDNN